MHTSSDTRFEWPGKGPLFESDSNKCRGTGPLFESSPRPLLKSGLQRLERYGTHQETISRKPEQMYTPSNIRLTWLGEGPLFKSDSIKRWSTKMQPLFESFLGPYLKSGGGEGGGSRRLEQMYTSSRSDARLEWPLFE